MQAAYPPPPAYFSSYTDDNLARHERRLRGEETEEDKLQPYLNLQPPAPLQGPYIMFGEQLNTSDEVPLLKEMGITQLFDDDCDRIAELKKLNHSLLLNFTELSEILSERPLEFAYKLEHIRLILINMHYLLNGYRPHQARDTLRLLMMKQIKRRQVTTDKVKSCCDEINALAQTILSRNLTAPSPPS
ncbi:Mediator of RNA polymerase II transcription subunit 7 [Irineochytrium annulatum]|nr:Mediator of RNA polymerase II transcription subunit 7 [Irineochytrium annulatum]